MDKKYEEEITVLKTQIKERDSDIQKAATFGKQLLEDKEKLSETLHQIIAENEVLKQEKYSLQLDLETRNQTINTQSSELEIINEEYDHLKKKLEKEQREIYTQKQLINKITYENADLEKSLQEAQLGNCELMKKIASKQQEIQRLQDKAGVSLNISLPQNQEVEENIDFYKLQNKRLHETVEDCQFQLNSSKLEETRLSTLVKQLEEEIKDRDKEIKACTLEMKKSQEATAELQCEIEMLKLDQFDEKRRGNSVFGELDDRRNLVEKEYKLLLNKYDNIRTNYENNRQELTKCKGQMAILLSMKSRNYQSSYIEKLEDKLMESNREIDNLIAKNKSLARSQNQHQLPKCSNEYAYLKVMYDQVASKNKTLENETATLYMLNRTGSNELAAAQQSLYRTQVELDSVKIEIMQLKQKLNEPTLELDTAAPVENKPKIEILPGYNLSPTTIQKRKSEVKLMTGFSPEVVYLKDNDENDNNNTNDDARPSYARCRPNGEKNTVRRKKEDPCAQQ